MGSPRSLMIVLRVPLIAWSRLPWEDLLKQLQDGEEMAKLGKQVSLPRTGTHLSDVVSVLLQKAAGDDTEKDVAKLIHQCLVRRDVVVKLIRTMQERGLSMFLEVHRMLKQVVRVMDQPQEKKDKGDGAPIVGSIFGNVYSMSGKPGKDRFPLNFGSCQRAIR